MALEQLDHYTVRTRPEDLVRVRDFYVEVLGLREGKRPPFNFPGHWLYCGGVPVVHLAGTVEGDNGRPSGTGKLDHVAFRASGLAAMRKRLLDLDVSFDERTVLAMGLHQLFLVDPGGIKVELNYPADEARALGR